jgi:hypothetical protein
MYKLGMPRARSVDRDPPSCDRSVGTLYLRTEPPLEVVSLGRTVATVSEREVYACRRCLRLQYPSQAENPVARSARRARRLGTNLDATTELHKPKWMRWSTYDHICFLLHRERELRAAIRALVEAGEALGNAEKRAAIGIDSAIASQQQRIGPSTDQGLSMAAVERARSTKMKAGGVDAGLRRQLRALVWFEQRAGSP